LSYEKEKKLNRIRLISSRQNPAKETVNITDAIDIIGWYQYQVHGKLVRACECASKEAIDHNGPPKDSDGSAKVALIGIDRSIVAWKILLTHLAADKSEIIRLIELLENLKNRVENRFPCARNFIRPGFDDNRPMEHS
jgi:hypothetical protein